MTREEAKTIIKTEQLHRWLWYEKPDRWIECMAIYQEADRWVVVATDERGGDRGSQRFFDDEGEALDDFIGRLRASERLLRGGHMTVNTRAGWGGKYTSPDDIDHVTP